MSKPGGKGSKAVAGAKGAAAEGRVLQAPPGQPENIRLTVAFAERYGLIAKLPDRPARRRGARGVSGFRQLRDASCYFYCRLRAFGAQIIEDKEN